VLLEDVAAAHRARASAAGIELRVEAPADLPLIDIDPVRMRQVVSNLVDNAIRAMPDGGSITLVGAALPNVAHGSAAAEGSTQAEGSHGISIEVSDDGPGIPSDIRDTVFDRFTKSATSRGSGLGLAIARAIVEAHGGSIAAGPGPDGRGTTVRIVVP
jgi:signal transduction histidine kinase